MSYFGEEDETRKKVVEKSEIEKARERQKALRHPQISDMFGWSEQAVKDSAIALHGILVQDINMGKKELLKDTRFIQGRLYEIITYIMSQQDKDMEQLLMEYVHPKLQYIQEDTSRVVKPVLDFLLCKTKPQQVNVTGIMMRKSGKGYEPDKRTIRSDMARLGFLILERGIRYGFYFWVGSIDEIRWMDMSRNLGNDLKDRDVVLSKEIALLPRVGKPLPASFTKEVVINRISPEICVRVYRIQPEMTFLTPNERDDVIKLKTFYSGYKMRAPGYGAWDVPEQMQDIRRQLLKVRDYVEAGLFQNARAMMMIAKVLFVDMVTVKDLNQLEIEESDYYKEHLVWLREQIKEGLREELGSETSSFVGSEI